MYYVIDLKVYNLLLLALVKSYLNVRYDKQ